MRGRSLLTVHSWYFYDPFCLTIRFLKPRRAPSINRSVMLELWHSRLLSITGLECFPQFHLSKNNDPCYRQIRKIRNTFGKKRSYICIRIVGWRYIYKYIYIYIYIYIYSNIYYTYLLYEIEDIIRSVRCDSLFTLFGLSHNQLLVR